MWQTNVYFSEIEYSQMTDFWSESNELTLCFEGPPPRSRDAKLKEDKSSREDVSKINVLLF